MAKSRWQCLLRSAKQGAQWDISDLLLSCVWTTQISGQPGKLVAKMPCQEGLEMREGDILRLYAEDKGIFYGYVFTRAMDGGGMMTVTAYDQMRYLKNVDSYALEAARCSDIFAKICAEHKLKYKVVHPGGKSIGEKIYEAKTLADILQDCFDRTAQEQGHLYFMRDEFGTLCHLDAAKMGTDLLLTQDGIVTDYQYESSIDRETHNEIMLLRERDKKRAVFLARDAAAIDRWGLLRKYERIDGEMNDAQAKKLAQQYLETENRPSRRLSIKALGDWRALCGNGLYIELRGVEGAQKKRRAIVMEAVHTLKNGLHSMELELEVDWE